ncbi:helix-turn-helix transcriptional regulator [Legionella londiniensis]|uniref:helix-turn-helix transcriptional regulator n=1 Tax=Legionella londiniensis TaxID=45068 RepID=UPI00073136C7|nr:YafY family protein [Legionella londiniensis]
MSRTQRLLELIQILRRHRYPVNGKQLADELGVSLRTLYRDITTLQSQGASIVGEPGVGYVLRPGFMLPPLMFSEEEIEALVLGSRWVARRADKNLRLAATNVLAKISSVLPEDLQYQLEYSGLLIGPVKTAIENDDEKETLIRNAIRREYKLQMTYIDVQGDESQRTIWPLALGYFEEAHVIVAWCELRSDFRHFRTDRISQLTQCEKRYPQRRQTLLKKWRKIHNIPEQ